MFKPIFALSQHHTNTKMEIKRLFLYVIWVLLLPACNGSAGDDGPLYKLPAEDLVELIRNEQLPPLEVVTLRDGNGHLISADSLIALQQTGEYFADFFLNQEGDIVEARLRPITIEDRELLSGRSKRVRLHNIDCSRKKMLLQLVYHRHQQVIKKGILTDRDANQRNLETVISIIEMCGMPTREEVDSIHMDAIWQIFQHVAGQKYRKKYFKELKSAAGRGDLDPVAVARLEDRILAADGQPQLYGTYLTQDPQTEVWVLYDLEAPEQVDVRRMRVGMGPLSEELQQWGIDFAVQQHQ